MKKMYKISIAIICFCFVTCSSSWTEDIDKNAAKIEKKGELLNQHEEVESQDRYFKTKLYGSEDFVILKTEYKHDSLMQTKSQFFAKDSVIFRYHDKGLIAVMSPKFDGNYAQIYEHLYYFEDGKNGIL